MGLKETRPVIRSLQKAFSRLAPSETAWSGRRSHGAEIDLDALVEEAAEEAAGLIGRGMVYLNRRPRLREVACAVLWDVSGSTERRLSGVNKGQEVINAAREALAMFAQSLAASSDRLAIWAYSGVGANRVDFYQLKDFAESYTPQVEGRIAAVTPMAQNRDGAAIRHAAHLLAGQPVRRRLLIVLGDGRPDDYGYEMEVSGGDLPAALLEARLAGVRTAALLLNPQGRKPHEAYLAIDHLMVGDLETLTAKLPSLYHRLTR